MLFLHVSLAWHSWRGVLVGLPDFSIFYTAGEILHEGRGFELYDDLAQERVQRSFSPIAFEKRESVLPYNHPPFEALIFIPFVRLPYTAAYLVWLAVNLGLMLALLILLRKNFSVLGSAPLYLWLLAGFGFYPIFIALLQGQDSILVLFCYAMAFLAFRKRAESPAGAWVGLGLCKPQLVLPFVFPLALLRRQRFLVGFLSVGLVLFLLGLAAVGWRGSLHYPLYAWARENVNSYAWYASVGEHPNVRGIVASLCPAGEPRLRMGLTLLVSLILLAGVTYAWRQALLTAAVYRDLVFALSLVATALLSYHIYVHDLSILFLAALIVLEVSLSSGVTHSWAKSLLYGCIGILFCSPLYLVLTLRYKKGELIGGVILIFFALLQVEFLRIQPGTRSTPETA
jgi:hypothetical protein